ncbi:MAG TPA: 50S ribosomal protein L11 methyltransferase [Rubrobacteraceae bacterium]|nr:50S ribosomal protein L11 methyltransferase [Rubrobacteraceae bacterium]
MAATASPSSQRKNASAASRTQRAPHIPRQPLPSTKIISLDHLRLHLEDRTHLTTSTVEVGGGNYRITHPAAADALIDEAEFDHDERLPYWADLWPSAIALARSIADQNLAGRRVIELGCGLGLPSVAALARGAEVLATDHYAATLDFAAHNARTNVGRDLRTALLDWRSPEIESLGVFDLVIGADVLYEALSGLALAELVPRLLSPRGEAVFADPNRNTAPVFLDEMEEQGFRTTTEIVSVEQGGRGVEIGLHRLRN